VIPSALKKNCNLRQILVLYLRPSDNHLHVSEKVHRGHRHFNSRSLK